MTKDPVISSPKTGFQSTYSSYYCSLVKHVLQISFTSAQDRLSYFQHYFAKIKIWGPTFSDLIYCIYQCTRSIVVQNPKLKKKRQTVCLKRSCNHCCSRKAISITYSRYVYVALGIQHAVRMGHTVICGLFGLQYFPYHLINGRSFE